MLKAVAEQLPTLDRLSCTLCSCAATCSARQPCDIMPLLHGSCLWACQGMPQSHYSCAATYKKGTLCRQATHLEGGSIHPLQCHLGVALPLQSPLLMPAPLAGAPVEPPICHRPVAQLRPAALTRKHPGAPATQRVVGQAVSYRAQPGRHDHKTPLGTCSAASGGSGSCVSRAAWRSLADMTTSHPWAPAGPTYSSVGHGVRHRTACSVSQPCDIGQNTSLRLQHSKQCRPGETGCSQSPARQPGPQRMPGRLQHSELWVRQLCMASRSTHMTSIHGTCRALTDTVSRSVQDQWLVASDCTALQTC